jgi:hypothetical protein
VLTISTNHSPANRNSQDDNAAIVKRGDYYPLVEHEEDGRGGYNRRVTVEDQQDGRGGYNAPAKRSAGYDRRSKVSVHGCN